MSNLPLWHVAHPTIAEPTAMSPLHHTEGDSRAEPIQIVFTVDDAFTEGFLCAVRSILDHADRPVAFTVISIQSETIWLHCACVLDIWNAAYTVARTPALRTIYAQSKRVLSLEVRRPYYLRLWMAELLPRLGRVLYLDCDLIVRRSLTSLWETVLDGGLLAAVSDPIFLEPHEAVFLRAHGGRYFNSGVLLIDLDRWRAEQVTSRTLDWVAVYRRAGEDRRWRQHWDQSPLNMALRSRWTSLSPVWNFTHMTRVELAPAYGITPDEYAEIARDPAIFHFIGPGKPWLHPDMHAFAHEYTLIAQRVRADWERTERSVLQTASEHPQQFHSFVQLVFEALGARLSPVRFIQVGADDGTMRAFVLTESWVGLLIETVAHLFDVLRQTYAGLPTVEYARLDADSEQVTHLKNVIDDYGVEPDILVIYDETVFEHFALARHRPMVIYLAGSGEPVRTARMLKRFDYLVVSDGDKTVAFQPSLLTDFGIADALGHLPDSLIR